MIWILGNIERIMDVMDIEFNKFLGLQRSEKPEYMFQLKKREELTNHLGTMHAGVLFTLAEATSGQLLVTFFPEWADRVIPVIRKSKVKYNKPGTTTIYSHATMTDETKSKIPYDLENRGRSIAEVSVDLYDEENTKIFSSVFEWFITVKPLD
jgi:acyl-coenzyme A thioesterase PaaI-like protein